MIPLARNILAIGAHPDDIEYGCLGFLLSRKKMDAQIHLYVASLGSAGDPSSGPSRMHESREAFGILNAQSLTFRDKNGIEAGDFAEVLDEMTALIARTKPDLILTLGPHDTHQEHKRLHEITIAAARRSRASILNYAIVSNTLDFMPQMFVDVAEVYGAKKLALACHKSQRDKNYMSEDYLNIFHSHTYASLHGLRYCEAFEVVRLFG